MIMTMTRSRRETVVFKHPFRIASVERLLPAGSYEVVTDEESMEGLSFPSFRPVATMMMVPAPPPRSSSVEMVTISSIDLSDARKPMRRRPDSDAPVDLDKHCGRAAPNTDFRRTLAEIERNAKVLRGRHLQLEPELLATPAKPLVGALPELKEPGRDLRIDACRGIALWCIFLDQVPNNIGSWLTLRNYGFSDTAEVFMFVSGVTCALAYGKAHARGGWTGVIGRTLWRSWDIYAAFLLLTLACAIVVYLAGGGRVADETNTRILLEHPGATLAHAAILQYRPVNTDVLPIFVVCHLLFRAAIVAAAASAKPDTRRLAIALCAGARLRLDRPGMAQQRLVLQSAGLAVAGCAWRVVCHRGQGVLAVDDLAHGTCTCRSLSGF
jgi:OpgC protein